MEFALLDHLERAAKSLKRFDDPASWKAYVEGFKTQLLRSNRRLQLGKNFDSRHWPFVSGVLKKIAEGDGLKVLAANVLTGDVKCTFERTYKTTEGALPKARFVVEDIQLWYVVEMRLDKASSLLLLDANADLPSWTDTLVGRLRAALDAIPEDLLNAGSGLLEKRQDKPPQKPQGNQQEKSPQSPIERDVVLAPGEVLRSAFDSGLKDYSACATEDEVKDLRRRLPSGADRVLPLGRYYRFGDASKSSAPSPILYLPGTTVPPNAVNWDKHPAETPAIYRGALVVAPQDSGKTMLILRWARAANRCGYSQFIVDVKGNLYPKLKEKPLIGTVYHFTTEPGVASDRINLLAGLGAPTDIRLAWKVRQLANAILPSEGFDEDAEQLYYLQNRTSWLCSLIHILKLYEFYWPERLPGRRADLGDLYHMILDPVRLAAAINEMMAYEVTDKAKARGDTFGGIRRWLLPAALLFGPTEVPGGQRPPTNNYQEFTQGLLTALAAFGRGGILHDKIRDDVSSPPGRLFELEDLDRDEPVTIVMTAREQELDDAVTVVSMAVKRLQHILFGRMGKRRRPVLLLLDETRRIRNFKPGQYITFAREAQAGCVIVYQSLDQIKDEAEITEILENVGTQIYLKSVVGNSAKHLIEYLPKRYRWSFSRTASLSDGNFGGTWTQQQDLIDYFTTGDLNRLPSGRRSALVYLNDHPSGKPFFVEMDEDRIAELA